MGDWERMRRFWRLGEIVNFCWLEWLWQTDLPNRTGFQPIAMEAWTGQVEEDLR